MNTTISRLLATVAATCLLLGLAATSHAQSDCKHRGALDALYCDENKDLVADPPQDPKRYKNPSTLAFTYSPAEDSAIYESVLKPFTDYLGSCTGKRVVYQKVQSGAAEVDAMRNGRLHVAGFSTGSTIYAVNLAGAIPFAVKGSEKGPQGYTVIVIVKKDSPYRKMTDLKGTRVAHVQPTSNSGNLAPRVFFPELGLTPDQDYKVLYSGTHDNSVMGVLNGDYDAAPVASSVLKRLAARGRVKEDDFRIIWTSDFFPTTAFAYAHDLEPKLRDTLVKCFYDYRYPDTLKKAFSGADRFSPITYQKDWAAVRKMAEGGGDKAKGTDIEKARK